MIHDKYGRQIEVGDEVIVRGKIERIQPDGDSLGLRSSYGCFYVVVPRDCEKVASDPGPFLTNDMPVKGDKCAG